MFNLKNISLILLSILFLTGSAFAGPANKLNEDHLVKSYLVVAVLAENGNEFAVSNKKTIYGFLNSNQKVLVDKIIAARKTVSNKI